MSNKKSFTLIELLVVAIIIGILAALALPSFAGRKERYLDKEAKVSLMLIRAAERIYRMELGTYYPRIDYTSTSDVNEINTYLKLSLPATIPAEDRNWAYSIDNSSATGIGSATRLGRTWTLVSTGDSSEDPVCTGACL